MDAHPVPGPLCHSESSGLPSAALYSSRQLCRWDRHLQFPGEHASADRGDRSYPGPRSVGRAVPSPHSQASSWEARSEGARAQGGARLCPPHPPAFPAQAHRHGQVQRRVAVLPAGVGVGPVGQQHHGAVEAVAHHRHVQSRVARGAGVVHVAASFQQQAGHLRETGSGPTSAAVACGTWAPGHCPSLPQRPLESCSHRRAWLAGLSSGGGSRPWCHQHPKN